MIHLEALSDCKKSMQIVTYQINIAFKKGGKGKSPFTMTITLDADAAVTFKYADASQRPHYGYTVTRSGLSQFSRSSSHLACYDIFLRFVWHEDDKSIM